METSTNPPSHYVSIKSNAMAKDLKDKVDALSQPESSQGFRNFVSITEDKDPVHVSNCPPRRLLTGDLVV